MIANIYGVGAQHSAPRKGYSDFVQHTGTVMSGQLRLVLNESEAFRVSSSAAQTFPVTFGYSQTSSVRLTYRPRFDRPKLERLANPLMELDYRGSREMANPLISSTPTNGVSWLNSLILSKTCDAVSQYNPLNISENAVGVCRKTKHEKYSGSEVPTKFVATCIPGMRKISHTPNQQIAGKEKGSTANATLWVNADGDQSFSCLAFLRCSALSLRPQASSTQVEKFTLEPSSFSRSTLASISAVSSCGKRIPLYMVLLFMWFFAMLSLIECLNKDKITAKNGTRKLFKQNALTCLNTLSNLFKQSDSVRMKIAKPSSVSSTDRASNHNVIGANTMACQHSTQTRPKFVFLFLGTPKDFPNTTPTVLRVEADTEDEGRAKFVGWTLIFAAQIRTEAPCRLQLFSTDEGFMWVYEQRQTVKESSHA
ncbi:host cell division inhibitor Icd-like protein [Serratia fonticola]